MDSAVERAHNNYTIKYTISIGLLKPFGDYDTELECIL